MNKTALTVFLAIFALLAKSQEQKITIHTPKYQGLMYLTYYYGKSLNIEDSALTDASGKVVFKKKGHFTPGIYSIVFPGKSKLLDLLIDNEPSIVVKADTTDLVNKTLVTGSPDNQLFLEYQKFVAGKGKQLQLTQQAWAKAQNKKDSATFELAYNNLNKELVAYRENVIKTHPGSLLATVFMGMKEPEVPNAKPRTSADSVANYSYYKKHYWDGVTFMDDRIIRTPFFLPKLERYFREVLDMSADSINKEADYLLLLARSNENVYKFLLNWLTDEYIYPKYMGLDAVFVHLFEKYHSKGISKWLNEKQLTTITNRAYMLMSNLIGERAANLEMTDTSNKTVHLYDVNADFTVVCFWDPGCGHCKEEVPRLDSFYRASWQKKGVKIFAVSTENDLSKWKEFINEHHLAGWTHVYQTEQAKKAEVEQNRPGFRQLYDITQTPTVYLLDKDKRIVAKKLTLEQIDELLKVKIKNKAKA